MDYAGAVQKAVVQAIEGILAPGIDGAGTPVAVYDQPPANAPQPFIAVDGHDTEPLDTYRRKYRRHSVHLAVHSNYEGHREAHAILDAVKARLHFAQLVLDAGDCVSCIVSSDSVNRESDEVTHRGTITVEITLGETA